MELTKEIWTQSDYDEFAEYLKTLADEKYKKFSDSLVPGGTQSIGIRVPILRQTAKAISKGDYASFLNCKNNAYREEIMIKGLVMSLIKCDYHEMLGYIKQYVAQITSWETCDIVSFKGLKKHLDEFLALYLATFEATKKWTMPLRNWGRVYGELSIMYDGRLV